MPTQAAQCVVHESNFPCRFLPCVALEPGPCFAQRLHNGCVLGQATNVTLASLAGSSVVQSVPRPHVALPIRSDTVSQPAPRGVVPASPAAPVHIPQEIPQSYVSTHPELPRPPAAHLGAEEDISVTSAPFCELEATVRIATVLAGRTCNSGSGECACVAPLVDGETWLSIQGSNNTGAMASATAAANVFAFCECGWTGARDKRAHALARSQ